MSSIGLAGSQRIGGESGGDVAANLVDSQQLRRLTVIARRMSSASRPRPPHREIVQHQVGARPPASCRSRCRCRIPADAEAVCPRQPIDDLRGEHRGSGSTPPAVRRVEVGARKVRAGEEHALVLHPLQLLSVSSKPMLDRVDAGLDRVVRRLTPVDVHRDRQPARCASSTAALLVHRIVVGAVVATSLMTPDP